MILAMMIGYIVILHLIFNVFKLIKASTRNKIYVTALGCFIIYCILLVINYYQPMSTDLRVVRYVIPLRTRLNGVISEVPVQPNLPLQKGDMIFRIDPRPFEAQVARLTAALAEAEQDSKMLPVELAAARAVSARSAAALVEAKQNAESLQVELEGAKANLEKQTALFKLAQGKHDRGKLLFAKSAISEEEFDTRRQNLDVTKASVSEAKANLEQTRLAFDAKIDGVNTIVVQARESHREAQEMENKARLALESTINGENTTVARIRAELSSAQIDLEDTIVRAPTDGYVTNLTLRPGQVIKPQQLAVVTFVSSENSTIVATFHQQVLDNIQPGDEVEIALDDLPGRTLSGNVKNINWGIPQGQVIAGGELVDSTPVEHGRFFVQFQLNDAEGLKLPAGEAGAAAIYTSRGRMWIPVRKVFFRWYTWLNFIITDMDVIGPRQ